MTAIFKPEGNLFRATEHAGGPWSPDMLQGSATTALMTREVERLAQKSGFAVRRLTFDLWRPAGLSAFAVETGLHTGRSRNEQVSVDFRLYLRRRIPLLQRAIVSVVESMVSQAERAGNATMPSYTHLRRAQPVLVAHVWLSHAAALRRDWDRFETARHEADLMPLGSGALAGSGFPFDREALAHDLGFEGITRNSMDVSGDRDFALDFMHAAGLTMLHLSRLAEDWILYSGEEYGWLDLAGGVTSGSSMMPQKRNPDVFEIARGSAARLLGDLTSVLVTLKGLPSGYNKDLQDDKRPLFDAVDTMMLVVPAVAGALDDVVTRAHGANVLTEAREFVAAKLGEVSASGR